MKKCYLYTRTATTTLDNPEGSLVNQVNVLLAYANKQGYEVVGKYSDVISGNSVDRPGLTTLLEACKRNKVNAVLVTEISRVGRQWKAVNTILKCFKKAHVNFDFGLDSSQNHLIKNVFIGLAQFEKDFANERRARL